MNTTTDSKLLRLTDVSQMTSLGKTTIKLWVVQGRFPPPSVLSKTIKVWHQRDIEKWINDLSAKKGDQNSPEPGDRSTGGNQNTIVDEAQAHHG